MRGLLAAGLAALAAAVAVAAGLRGPGDASGAQLLANPGFESWAPSGPTGWAVTGGSPAQSADAVEGASAAEIASVGGSVSVRQTLAASPGAGHAAAVWVKLGAGATSATLSLSFLDGNANEIGGGSVSDSTGATGSYVQLEVDLPSPPNAAFVTFEVSASGAGAFSLLVDAASLDEAAAPTPTPTPTNTPSPTAEASATPTTPAATPTTSGATATSTPTPTTTAAAPPGSTNTPASTATTAPTSTPTKTPTRVPSSSGADPSQGVTDELRNPGFEFVSGGLPTSWSKFGGVLGTTSDALSGASAGTLTSTTTSTKWIYQVVRVTGGQWYEAGAMARVSHGAALVSMRLSWYASADGSGSQLDVVEGTESSLAGWSEVRAGPAEAPATAQSVRVRLMVRPITASTTAAFDDVWFATASPAQAAPTKTATPTATPTPTPTSTATPGGPAATQTPTPGAATPAPTTGLGGAAPAATRAPRSVGGATPGADVAALPRGKALRLSEVLADPVESGIDRAYEWVELYNAGEEPIDLEGWRLGDAVEDDVLPSLVVPAGAYALIAGPDAELPDGALAVRVLDGAIGAGLNNGGDAIRLAAPDGTVVDAMSFGDDASVLDPAPRAAGAGETIGARTFDGTGGERWALTLRPTPGEPNAFAEPTPEATGTAPPGATDEPGASTPDPSATLAERPLVEDDGDGDGGSQIPLLILAGAIGAGFVAIGSRGPHALRHSWEWLRAKMRRGR